MMLRDTLKAFALGIVVVGLVSAGVALAVRASHERSAATDTGHRR